MAAQASAPTPAIEGVGRIFAFSDHDILIYRIPYTSYFASRESRTLLPCAMQLARYHLAATRTNSQLPLLVTKNTQAAISHALQFYTMDEAELPTF
jgi:hypothetical protein